ncbi:MAG: methionyl-tRNA formyltransferase [bacterium]|nr:methionyl-tRNA formyltransferase [bacterium]
MNNSTFSPIRVIYFGTPKFASSILLHLNNSPFIQIVGVVTGIPKTRGRNASVPTDVAKVAKRLGLDVFECDSPKSDVLYHYLQNASADVGVVVAWKILPERIFTAPKFGTINLHASLLPKYRGAAPIQRAIWNGEKESGLTVFLLNSGIDSGKILLQKKCPLYDTDTTGDVLERFIPIGAEMLEEAIVALYQNTINPIEQQDDLVTLAPKIKPEERRINWNQPAIQILRQIHALSPEPCAYTEVDQIRILFYRVSIAPKEENYPCGTILVEKGQIKFVTSDGTLVAESLCLEGKKKMTGKEFYNGYRHFHLKRCHIFV